MHQNAFISEYMWELDTIGPPFALLPIAPYTVVTLSFWPKSGVVSGCSGCNYYKARYVMDQQQIRFGRLESTLMACDEISSDIEYYFVTALYHAYRYYIIDTRLEIIYDDGKSAIGALRFHSTSGS
jgi:heat shock protein HslJ